MNEAPIAIVAGGGGELGRSVVVKLVSDGYTVVAVDRDKDRLDGLPAGVLREVVDPSDPMVPVPLVDRLAGKIGPPVALVNTLGTFIPGEALATTPDDFLTMLNVNLRAALSLTQAVAPYMIERGSGSIVHMSARQGVDAMAGMTAYGASKAGLMQLIRGLHVELRPKGIRVNSIAPQLINTETNRRLLSAEMLALAVAPEALAEIVSFLISDAAAPISGAILPAYG
jgi:NAD(P)-dependent dehydrogenase (short-subunit alcohol dehydrogenase family)